MTDISATQFKNNFFKYLDQVERGETINVIRNETKVATITPNTQVNWQGSNDDQFKIRVRNNGLDDSC